MRASDPLSAHRDVSGRLYGCLMQPCRCALVPYPFRLTYNHQTHADAAQNHGRCRTHWNFIQPILIALLSQPHSGHVHADAGVYASPGNLNFLLCLLTALISLFMRLLLPRRTMGLHHLFVTAGQVRHVCSARRSTHFAADDTSNSWSLP